MHSFPEVIDRCVAFTLSTLRRAQDEVIAELQTSGATRHIKNLQMIQLQKAVMAVGMFSIFEAHLQDGLHCKNGFQQANELLGQQGEATLKDRFVALQAAINVLKHGRGKSYDVLVSKATALGFRVKLPGETFFDEGDVSEVSTLIEVDDDFVRRCADVIREVSEAIRRARPDFPL
jgi:hypothetical protein